MVSDRFKRATRRTLSTAGREVTVTNFTDDGTTDAHGDPVREVDTTETHDAILRQPTEELTASGPNGQQVAVEVEIFLPDTATVHEADADNSDRYATEITDSIDDETYRALAVWNEGNGQLRVAGVSTT